MEGALATLALHPEVCVVLLINRHLLLPLNVDMLLFGLAAVTKHISLLSQHVLASKAGLLHDSKFTQA